MSLVPYATSAFSQHSLISTVLVVQNVVNGKLTLHAVLQWPYRPNSKNNVNDTSCHVPR